MIAAGLRSSLRSVATAANAASRMGFYRSSIQGNSAKAFSTSVDSFLAASSSVYVEQMYTAWKKDSTRYVFCLSCLYIWNMF